MEQTRLNAYHIMWLFVFFDLPTNSKKERRVASMFRKSLLQDGFSMMQYSVYTRHCASRESAEVHRQRVQKNVPVKGLISVLTVTDKQYGQILNYIGKKKRESAPAPQQLELF